jgi:lipoprotein-anchoring transpeptidase ErfK/SrfK
MPPRRSRLPRRFRRQSGRGGAWLLVGLIVFSVGFIGTRLLPRDTPTRTAGVTPPAPAPAPPPAGTTAAPITPRPATPRVTFTPPPPQEPTSAFPRPVNSWLEVQVELARRLFSCGPIDGVGGAQTGAALRAFQENEGLPVTGQLDTATRQTLLLSAPPYRTYLVTADDLAGLEPVSPTWLGKSQQTSLAHETVLERLAERFHAHPNHLRAINPGTDWAAVTAGTPVLVTAVERPRTRLASANVHIRLAERILQVRDPQSRIIAHFPVSIARNVDKRPVGELRVTVVVPDPNYTFNPEVFPESAEGRELGRKLILPPGPNNPVGVAWIGLNRPGYGIHGTPVPEQVGRTESHGCFRLANWDARTLLDLAWVGLPVFVDP